MNEESKGEIIIYRAEDGETRFEVSLKEDTVWFSYRPNILCCLK